jgi:hypothetical protein
MRAYIIGVMVALALACSPVVWASDARITPNTWKVCTSLSETGCSTPNPSEAKATCTWYCQNYTTTECTGGGQQKRGYWEWNLTSTGTFPSTGTPGTPAGLNGNSHYYGRCACDCLNTATGSVSGMTASPAQYAFADASCGDSNEVLVASYYPASCTYPYGTSPSGVPPATSCSSKLGVAYKLATTTGAKTMLCWQGCEYTTSGPWTTTSGVTTADFSGSGAGCVWNATNADSAAAPDGGGTGGGGSGGGEDTDLLTAILAAITALADAITGGGVGDSHDYTGQMDRTADASERAASAAESSYHALDMTAPDEAEAASAAAEGAPANATEANLHAALPHSTVDFSSSSSGFTVNLFGTGSCPAPTYMFDYHGTPISFSYAIVCQLAIALSGIIVMAGAVTGFRVAMS